MIASAAIRTGIAPCNPFDQYIVVSFHLNNGIKLEAFLRQHLIKRLCLRFCTREAIENNAILAIRLIQPIRNNARHDIVGNEFASFHHCLGFLADFRAGGNGRAQHVAGGKLNQTMLVFQPLRLRSLAGTGRSQKNQDHLRRPPSLVFLISPSY